jgi:hypothetical protein
LHLSKPSLTPGAHGGQRPGLALFGQRTRAAPAMKTTAFLTWYWPLTAEAVPVAYAGAATLLVFPMGAGLRHRWDPSMQLAFLILHLGA